MKIPNKVVVAGIEWIVEQCTALYNDENGDSLYGEVNFSETKIKIALNAGCIIDGKDASFPFQDNIRITALFHELWHIYCNMADIGELDTEQNAKLFSFIAMNIFIKTGSCLTLAINNALTIMIERGIIISDIEKSVIRYFMNSTEIIE